DTAAFCALLDALRSRYGSTRDVHIGLAFHSLRAVTPAMIDAVLAHAGGIAPVHMHVAEQTAEVADCIAWSGQRPVAWLLDHVAVDARWCLVHATHLDDVEVGGLAASGAV